VTHHVEEIPPGFTHVLLLRGGKVVAAGPIDTTLTAASLGEKFGITLTLERVGDRWAARAS
jgi:iron complex transport system ATP-binding protein